MLFFRYDTGVCPRCGSRLTARLRTGRDGKAAFRFGSPVVYSHNPGKYNCTCCTCGVMWTGYPHIATVPFDTIDRLLKEWEKNEQDKMISSIDETGILNEMACDLGMTTDKQKRNRNSGAVRISKKIAGFIINETLSSPGRSFQSLKDDLTGTPLERKDKGDSK